MTILKGNEKIYFKESDFSCYYIKKDIIVNLKSLPDTDRNEYAYTKSGLPNNILVSILLKINDIHTFKNFCFINHKCKMIAKTLKTNSVPMCQITRRYYDLFNHITLLRFTYSSYFNNIILFNNLINYEYHMDEMEFLKIINNDDYKQLRLVTHLCINNCCYFKYLSYISHLELYIHEFENVQFVKINCDIIHKNLFTDLDSLIEKLKQLKNIKKFIMSRIEDENLNEFIKLLNFHKIKFEVFKYETFKIIKQTSIKITKNTSTNKIFIENQIMSSGPKEFIIDIIHEKREMKIMNYIVAKLD